MNNLIKNIDKIHTTKMGIERLKRNLQIETPDIVEWCKTKISSELATIER